MNKISVNVIILLTFLLYSNLLRAQKDYVVTFKGDTLRGEVFTTLLGSVRFIDQNTGKEEKVSRVGANIKLYFISDDSLTYVSVKTSPNTKPQFLKRLLDGRIQLFEKFVSHYAPAGGVAPSNSFWYAVKEDGPVLEIKTNNLFASRTQRKENFYSLLGDYPALLEKFEQEKAYSFDLIKSYIRTYNTYFETKP